MDDKKKPYPWLDPPNLLEHATQREQYHTVMYGKARDFVIMG